MTTCQHDPMYTNDGRCSKCYPPKRAIMVRHIDGTIETDGTPRPGYIAKSTTTLPEAQAAADEKHAQYRDWQHGERGQGCAGNSTDEYDSSTEGHW